MAKCPFNYSKSRRYDSCSTKFNNTYTFEATNILGCIGDTTIEIVVLPFTSLTCFSCDSLGILTSLDAGIAQGDSIQLSANTTITSFDDLEYGFDGNSSIPTNSFLDIPIQVSNVINQSLEVGDIASICLDVNHGMLNDVDVFLIAPSGENVRIDNG